MICWKILTLAVLSADANHEMVYKREIVQYNDGLFYHEGPYVSHHQYEISSRLVSIVTKLPHKVDPSFLDIKTYTGMS